MKLFLFALVSMLIWLFAYLIFDPHIDLFTAPWCREMIIFIGGGMSALILGYEE